MPKDKIFIDWSKIAGARERPKRLLLHPSENSLYKCPVECCEHEGFSSKRGVRKHMHTVHPWFYYFDQNPLTSSSTADATTTTTTTSVEQYTATQSEGGGFEKPEKGRRSFDTSNIPCYPMSSPAGFEFAAWLSSAAGGGKSSTQANQIAKRCLKFLKLSYEDEGTDLTEDIIDFCLGSPTILCQFISAKFLRNFALL